MVDKQLIIHKYRVEGESIRKIARDLGLNRKTVSGVISGYRATLESDEPEEALEKFISARPKYQGEARPRRILTDTIKTIISEYLEENKYKRDHGLEKQCKSRQTIWECLVESGYNISYPSVCKYIGTLNSKQLKPATAYIRAYYEAGEVCEFDWGEVKLKLAGKWVKFNMAVFTLAHSNARKAYLFRHQNTLAFMESHRNFFKDVKGVPLLMVYDNMRVAISKFTGKEKEPTEALLRLSTFYKFAFRFCNVRAGWEKGHVERSVSVVRKAAFSVKDSFNTIEDANEYLSGICDKLNNKNKESVKVDIEALQPQINTIGCFEQSAYKVDKWATINMKNVHYSVPDNLVGKVVDIRIYSEKIIIYYEQKKIATHQRIYTSGEWSVQLEHYLTTFERKPRAIASSVALKQASDKVQRLFNSYCKDTPRNFALLMRYISDNNIEIDEVITAFEQLKSAGINHPSIDQIKVKLSKENSAEECNYNDYTSNEFYEIEKGAIDTLQSLTAIMNHNDTLPQRKLAKEKLS